MTRIAIQLDEGLARGNTLASVGHVSHFYAPFPPDFTK